MKNFLILGGDGYIGSKLVEKLRGQKKNKIISISKKSNNKGNFFKIDIFKNYKWFKYINNKSIIFFLAFENNLYFLEKNFYKVTKQYNQFLLDFINFLKKKEFTQKLFLLVLYHCTHHH